MSYITDRILNPKDEWDSKIPKFRQKVDKLYQSGRENAYNPFLDENGSLINPYVNYQAVLDNPSITSKAKEFIANATGLTPTQITSPFNETQNENTDSPAAVSSTNTSGVSAALPETKAASPTSGNKFVDTAKKYLGTKYVWGGSSPSGFDCSGLMQYTFAQNGVKIPRTAREQYKGGSVVSQNNLQAGDLVFFKGSTGSSTSPGHVGMYIGNGQYIQAPKTGDVVKISDLVGRKDYVGARRYY